MNECIETESLNVEFFSISEFKEIKAIDSRVSYISGKKSRRRQAYSLELELKGKVIFSRNQGFAPEIDTDEIVVVEVFDENCDPMIAALDPEFIWDFSGFWFDSESFYWAHEVGSDLCDVLFNAFHEMCEFFGWSFRRILPKESYSTQAVSDSLQITYANGKTVMSVIADEQVLDHSEFMLRRFSVDYHKSCLWLGTKISFPVYVYLEPAKLKWKIDDLLQINVGDLLALIQIWDGDNCVKLSSFAKCHSSAGVVWSQPIYVNIEMKGVQMEFQDEDWDVSESDIEEIKIGEHGPDIVNLDVYVGSTSVSFNELCDLQEGSLIEINNNSLPIVTLKVANESIFEGELVRLNDQLMVQVTKKIT